MISFQINEASSKGGGLWFSSNSTGTDRQAGLGWRQPIGSIARDVRAAPGRVSMREKTCALGAPVQMWDAS